MKPILKYSGGKAKEIKQFSQYIPQDFDTYLEPFFGGGAVYFYLEPQKAVVNDVNTRLINFYKDLVKNYPATRQELDQLGNLYAENRKSFELRRKSNPNERVLDENEELYYSIRNMFNRKAKAKYSYSSIYYFLNKTAYSGMIRYNKKGEFNVPYGRYKAFNTNLLTRQHYALLKQAKIMNSDYKKVFEQAKENDFMFLDPPYDTAFSDYGNGTFTGGFGEKEQRQLAEDFKNLSCKALMVISETALIDELYQPYIKAKYHKNYAVNIRNRFKSKANHLIITNY